MKKYTAFCLDAYQNDDTTWISCVEAEDLEGAITAAREAAAADWECSPDDVFVMGIAEGDVKILHWED